MVKRIGVRVEYLLVARIVVRRVARRCIRRTDSQKHLCHASRPNYQGPKTPTCALKTPIFQDKIGPNAKQKRKTRTQCIIPILTCK